MKDCFWRLFNILKIPQVLLEVWFILDCFSLFCAFAITFLMAKDRFAFFGILLELIMNCVYRFA